MVDKFTGNTTETTAPRRGPLPATLVAPSLRGSLAVVVLVAVAACGGKSDADRIDEASTKIASWMGTVTLLDSAAAHGEVRASFAKDTLEKAATAVAEQAKAVAGVSDAPMSEFNEATSIVSQSRAAVAQGDSGALLRFAEAAGRLRDRIEAAKGRS